MNPISSVAEAWRLRVRRQSAEAQRICRAVLAEVPSHPGALHLLATIAFEEGPKHAAAEMLGVEPKSDGWALENWITLFPSDCRTGLTD